jgi:hypothetical protein
MPDTQFAKKVVKPTVEAIYTKAIDLSLEEEALDAMDSDKKFVPWDDDHD